MVHRDGDDLLKLGRQCSVRESTLTEVLKRRFSVG